ncbi:MAG: hypothetical protein E7639_04730 [Ruminococcaceae bacterium]|nr:hypothetical protein [Oscillospiraceae bacterium]
MKELIKALDNLPWLVKLILCVPALDIVWCISRVCRSLVKENLLGVVLGILTIIPGAAFVWVIDILCVLVNKKIWWID